MALRFMDGFDHYATADLGNKWEILTGNGTITAGGRNGTQGLHLTSLAIGETGKTFTTGNSTMVVGFAIKPAAHVSAQMIGQMRQAAVLFVTTNTASMVLNADNTISVYLGNVPPSSGATLLGTSVTPLTVGVYQYLEWKFIFASLGSFAVRLNGTPILSGSTIQPAIPDKFVFTSASGAVTAGITADIDDFYVLDGTPTKTDFLGDMRVVTLTPNANGDTNTWAFTGGGVTTNFEAVDETFPDGDTTYVSNGVVGNVDLYNYTNLSGVFEIKGVQTDLYVRNDDVGTHSIAPVFKTGGTSFDSPTQTITNAYKYYTHARELNPFTGLDWTTADVNALQAGIKLIS